MILDARCKDTQQAFKVKMQQDCDKSRAGDISRY